MKVNSKFKFISLFSVLFFATTLMAEPVIILSDNKDDYEQTSNGYVLHFNIDASAVEIDNIHANITTLNEGFGTARISISTELISEGHYTCSYTVDHQNQPEYVHKMLLSSGFNSLKFKGQSYGIEKIIDILYDFQD